MLKFKPQKILKNPVTPFEPMIFPQAPLNRPRDLLAWPLQDLADLTADELQPAVSFLDLKSQSSWICDQMLAHFGRWKVALVEGQPDARETVRLNCQDDPWQQGLWQLACRLPRGALVSRQLDQPEFSALVPLILCGIRLYQDIPYSAWNRENLHDIMPWDLHEALNSPWPDFSSEDILSWRAQGLVIRSGSREGESRDPKSAFQLYGIQDTPLWQLPRLQQCMVAQTWVCHPDVRHRNMILHTDNWDLVPEPLIQTDVTTWQAAPWNTTTS
jgi:hypothetical protein